MQLMKIKCTETPKQAMQLVNLLQTEPYAATCEIACQTLKIQHLSKTCPTDVLNMPGKTKFSVKRNEEITKNIDYKKVL